jgi:glycosyltransferase involved in cell wall biosynthesis
VLAGGPRASNERLIGYGPGRIDQKNAAGAETRDVVECALKAGQMERKPRVVVVSRRSISIQDRLSMSVKVRLIEPLMYLHFLNDISLQILDEGAISDTILESTDLFLLSRSYSKNAFELMNRMKLAGKKIIYDVDDYLFAAPRWTQYVLTHEMVECHEEHLRLADCVTVSNQVLKEELAGFDGKIAIIPSCINLSKFPCESRRLGSERLVYTNLMDVKLISARDSFLSAIIKFLELHETLGIDVFGDSFEEMSQIPRLIYRGYVDYDQHKRIISSENYVFALCPLGGDEDGEAMTHNRFKSSIKYLEYGAARVAGIYSDTPAYRGDVVNLRNGLIVRNREEEWFEAMEVLAANEDLRESIARSAYEDVSSRYDVRLVAPRWREVMERVGGMSRGA